MPLRQSNSCYDTQDPERVLLVFDGGLNDRPCGGVVFYAGLGTEASADLDFGLGRPECLLAIVVGGRHGRVGKKVKTWSLCLAMLFLSLSSAVSFPSSPVYMGGLASNLSSLDSILRRTSDPITPLLRWRTECLKSRER